MIEQDRKEPKLNFTNEVEDFCGPDEDKLLIRGLFGSKCNIKEETICKIQDVDSLKKLKQMFDKLVQIEDNCYYSHVGDKCFLFFEDGKIKVKTIKDYIYTKKVNTSLGLIISEDNGEFGGELILITNDNEKYHLDSFMHTFEYVFEYNDKIYAISSLAHISARDCSLHEIKKSNGKYQIITIFESDNMYFSGYYIDENYLYFYSNEHYNGLCRFNLDNNKLEIIHTNLCPSIKVNSLIKKDNFIYIYGNYNIVKYDLNSKEIVSIYTNLEHDEISEYWFVSKDVKLIDVWDEIIIKED